MIPADFAKLLNDTFKAGCEANQMIKDYYDQTCDLEKERKIFESGRDKGREEILQKLKDQWVPMNECLGENVVDYIARRQSNVKDIRLAQWNCGWEVSHFGSGKFVEAVCSLWEVKRIEHIEVLQDD